MLSIKNNMMASNAARHLGRAYDGLSKSVERLSSGLRINSAKDDAAGLAVRELIRADIAVLQQGSRNALDGTSLLQTMEGAMGVIDDNLIRMLELAEQASTGAYSDAQRAVMNAEFAEMADEIDRVAESATFNITLLNSDTGSVSIHVGTETTIDVDKVDMTKDGLDLLTGVDVDEAVWKAAMDDTDTTAMMSVSADDDVTMTIQFEDTGEGTTEDMITFNMAASSTYTIDQLVSEINALSQDLGYAGDGTNKAYDMASVVENDDGTFQLKFTSRLEADQVTINVSSDTAGDAGDITMGGSGGVNLADILTAGQDLADETDFDETTNTGGLNILSAEDALASMDVITTAINTKDEARASFGYKMKRLESTIAILDIQAENLRAAESRISDVDVATEMTELTRTQVLAQAGISMLTQANTMPQMALALLR